MISKTMDQIEIGDVAEFSKTVTETDVYLYAGITDNCMMGMLLMKLPYNKKRYNTKVGGGTCAIS